MLNLDRDNLEYALSFIDVLSVMKNSNVISIGDMLIPQLHQ